MITLLGIASSTSVIADPPHRRWHGDIHHFHRYDYPRWRSGHWYHGHHGGRLGWWWVAADAWYYYPAPVYPYPNPYSPYTSPHTVVIEPERAPQREPIWYYCKSSRKYYPYVSVCPEGWRSVPAQPRDNDADYDDARENYESDEGDE